MKLSGGYSKEVSAMDLSRARTSYERCQKVFSEGAGDENSKELLRLLSELLNEGKAGADNTDERPEKEAIDEAKGIRGEVVLKVAENSDGKTKAAILEKVVTLSGVVSVTFEGAYVIVSTRSQKIAADAVFLADLLSAVKDQGLQGVSLVSASSAGSNHSSPVKTGGASGSKDPAPAADDADAGDDGSNASEDEPKYLDDEDQAPQKTSDRESTEPAAAPSGPGQWSFFAHGNWMTARRVQEFGDDPTIAARLAKAKQREEERRQEEHTRIGMLSNWFGRSPSRS